MNCEKPHGLRFHSPCGFCLFFCKAHVFYGQLSAVQQFIVLCAAGGTAVRAHAAADALIRVHNGLSAMEAALGLAAYLLLCQPLAQILEGLCGGLSVNLRRSLARSRVYEADANADVVSINGLEARVPAVRKVAAAKEA